MCLSLVVLGTGDTTMNKTKFLYPRSLLSSGDTDNMLHLTRKYITCQVVISAMGKPKQVKGYRIRGMGRENNII